MATQHPFHSGRLPQFTLSPEMEDKKRITLELLSHVFKAAPLKVEEFFAKSNVASSMVLTKTSYNEGYFSEALNQFVCFRTWKAISPLQAAARCLDNFLVVKLLSYVEKDEKLRRQAAEQLQEVLSKPIKDSAEKVKAKAMLSEDICAEIKVNKESYGVAQNINVDFADDAEYGAPFKALISVYQDFIKKFQVLSSKNKSDEINKLWEQVGECHKRLPIYGLQVFFSKSKESCSLKHQFTNEPEREECRYYQDDTLLDLDKLGSGTCLALYKGGVRGGAWAGRAGAQDYCGTRLAAERDWMYMKHHLDVREQELENIIDCLRKPGVAITTEPPNENKEKKEILRQKDIERAKAEYRASGPNGHGLMVIRSVSGPGGRMKIETLYSPK